MDRFVPDRGSYAFGRFRMDAAQRALTRDGATVALTPTVFETLLYLVENSSRLVTKSELLGAVWRGRFVEESNLTQTVFMLRKVLRDAGDDGSLIVTAPGRGYRFTADVRRIATVKRDVRPGAALSPLLAILPFDNLSTDLDLGYFADGVTEEIQRAIRRATDLRVIGRASSFQFRGADKAAGGVAAALRATHVLDGSVRRMGGKVRISAELTECAGQTGVWSDRFDRDIGDIFALQDEIAGEVAKALTSVFTPSVATGPIDPPTRHGQGANTSGARVRVVTKPINANTIPNRPNATTSRRRAWLALATSWGV